MDICICVLMTILLIAQLLLAFKQIKRKAPDGKILLIINLAVIFIWTPLSVAMFITDNGIIKLIWCVVSLIYVAFTVWYTSKLQKTF